MKRSELKTGHILETKKEEKYLVLRNVVNQDQDIAVALSNSKGFYYLNRWNENLKFTNGESLQKRKRQNDIVKVYRVSTHNFPVTKGVQWKRETSIDITVKINGETANLSDLSEETILKLRKNN